MRPRERRPAGCGGNVRGASAIGARPEGGTRRHREVSYDIDEGQTWRGRLWPIESAMLQSETEQGIGSDQMLSVERGIGHSETANIEEGVGGEC
jgi:hypothetical protein